MSDLYSDAQMKISRKKYKEAQEAFQQVFDEASDSQLRIRSLLNLGDSFFYDENYEEARFHYQKFLELYPAHEFAVRAQYQLAMCDFLQIKTPARDQTFTKNAISGFEKVINNYPKSPYTEDSKKKLEFARKKLAEHEFLIGKFYYEQKKYQAAIFRFNHLLEKYPNIGFADEILYYLGDSYYQRQSFDHAKAAYSKLVNRYPKSKYIKIAKKRLQDIK